MQETHMQEMLDTMRHSHPQRAMTPCSASCAPCWPDLPPRNSHPACLQEMIALALIIAPSEGNDPLKYFLRAIEQYAKLPGARARLLVSRCALMTGGVFNQLEESQASVWVHHLQGLQIYRVHATAC